MGKKKKSTKRKKTPRPAKKSTGLIIVLTGPGKGKTTSSFGMAMRAAGGGLRVKIFQFIKGPRPSGERISAEKLPGLEVETVGLGFLFPDAPPEKVERHRKAAEAGWEKATQAISSGNYDMVILDEINVALHLKLIKTKHVLETIRRRPAHVHVVLTGRNAPRSILASSDTITHVTAVKHHWESGVPPQRGIEF
jgi:cob(I)alamin adenosyltransferase